jgi:hypothetical protein
MGVAESRVYRLIPVYLLSCKFNSPESGEETKNWFMDALGRLRMSSPAYLYVFMYGLLAANGCWPGNPSENQNLPKFHGYQGDQFGTFSCDFQVPNRFSRVKRVSIWML